MHCSIKRNVWDQSCFSKRKPVFPISTESWISLIRLIWVLECISLPGAVSFALSCQVVLGSFAGAASGEETNIRSWWCLLGFRRSNPGSLFRRLRGSRWQLRRCWSSSAFGKTRWCIALSIFLRVTPPNKQATRPYCNWGLYGYPRSYVASMHILHILYQTIIRLAGSIQPKHQSQSFSHRTACEIKFLFTGLRTPSIDDKYMEGQKVVYIYNMGSSC